MSSFLYKLNRYSIYNIDSINQRIYNTVKVSQSEYLMNKSSLTAQYKSRDNDNLNWNTRSDRLLPANSLKNFNTVTRNGNSRKSTITRLRPGALTPGGHGVDVKHNSYARYLARKKGETALKQEKNYVKINPKAVVNNKFKKYSILSSKNCICDNTKFETVEYDTHCPSKYIIVDPAEPEVDGGDSQPAPDGSGLQYTTEQITVITDVNDQQIELFIDGSLDYDQLYTLKKRGLPDNVTVISGSIPAKNNIKAINIGTSVTDVSGLNDAAGLTSLTFKEGSNCNELGMNAFSNTGITTLTIPKSLTSIRTQALANNDSLTEVRFENQSLIQSIASDAFVGTTNLNIYMDGNTLINIDMQDIRLPLSFGLVSEFFGSTFSTLVELFDLVKLAHISKTIDGVEYIVNDLSLLFTSTENLTSSNLVSLGYICRDTSIDFYMHPNHNSGKGQPNERIISEYPNTLFSSYTNIDGKLPMYLHDQSSTVPDNIPFNNMNGLRWFTPNHKIIPNQEISIARFTISPDSSGIFTLVYGDSTMNEYQLLRLNIINGVITK
tara:strand:+ start:259 stop:1911 length:1653 start_codon:yes stop_codon:yes gene_type:complete